jgi:hypothetical protein
MDRIRLDRQQVLCVFLLLPHAGADRRMWTPVRHLPAASMNP